MKEFENFDTVFTCLCLIAWNFTRNAHDAQDIAGEAVRKLVGGGWEDQLMANEVPPGLMYWVVRNAFYDHLKRQKIHCDLDLSGALERGTKTYWDLLKVEALRSRLAGEVGSAI